MWSSYLHLPSSWDHMQVIIPGLLVEMRSSSFLLRLTSNCDPPDLCFPSSWDYRHQLLKFIHFIQILLYHKLSISQSKIQLTRIRNTINIHLPFFSWNLKGICFVIFLSLLSHVFSKISPKETDTICMFFNITLKKFVLERNIIDTSLKTEKLLHV
jgi:hypothetical protein